MKRVRPSRIRWYSSATGSLTLSTMSRLAPDVVGGAEDAWRPAATYSSSLICGPDAGVLLDEHLVPVGDELVHADRRDGHAVLVVLDFPGDCRPSCCCTSFRADSATAPLPR